MNEKKGLTMSEAKQKLKEYGPNILPEKPPPSDFSIFLLQLKSPLVYVLIGASAVTFVLKHYSDTVIILIAVLVNTILGFMQERKANLALSALKKLITLQAEVLRDKVRVKIDAKDVVPGDIVYLTAGTKIPADGNLISANRLFIDEAVLTGESSPVNKFKEEEVYMGTIVLAGLGEMIVVSTGAQTKIGQIAIDIQEPQEDTPLKKQMADFSRNLVYLVGGLTIFVFLTGAMLQKDLVEMFTTSVALAVSAVPEGLLVGLTVVLAIGMQRILKRKGLVRRLLAAETLGGVTTICLDKTGTLTKGQLQVVEAVGELKDIATQMVLANDLDDALVISAYEWAKQKLKLTSGKITDLNRKFKLIDSIPFSSEKRFYASLHKQNNESVIYVNGAPDFILKWSTLTKNEKKVIEEKMEELTKQGRRLMGLAKRKVGTGIHVLKEEDAMHSLEWVGLLAFSDPVRPGVSQALEKADRAGIKTMVITGDYSKTAIAVMKELGMDVAADEVLLGEDLLKLTPSQLKAKVSKIKLFARTTPDQKLKIVEALKEIGEVVAMMGDGVNDAPALRKADIGIVVGDATDVARESADLVLLDSHFDTVLAAVEEGRGIFDNIRKIIVFLMSSAFNGITAVVGAMILGLGLPVSAAQILWINLVTDGFPDLALTVDPKREGIMDDDPRHPSEPLVTGWMKIMIAIVSVTSGLFALGMYIYTLKQSNDEVLARSTAFVALGFNSLVYVFAVRTLKEPFWKEGFFDNKWLLVAVFVGFLLQILPFATPITRQFFDVVLLPTSYWMMIVVASILTFLMIEVLKTVFRRKLN